MSAHGTRRFARWSAGLVLVLTCAQALADTSLSQGNLSSNVFRRARAAQNAIRGGQYSDALSQLNTLQSMAGNAYETAVIKELYSDLAIARGDYATALGILQPVVQQNVLPPGEQHDAQLTLAKLYVAGNQYQAAVDVMRSWMAGQENAPPDALITLAQAYAELGQCRQAIPYAKRATDIASEPPQEWYQLLVACQYEIHDYASAAESLQGLLSRYPEQLQYWQQLGQTYAQMGDNSKALAVYALMYRQGMVKQPQDYLTLASLYVQNNIPFQAAQVLQEGLQSGVLPASDANYTMLASVWQDAGDTERAVAALGEAAKVSRTGDAYLAQAQIYAARHEWLSVIDTAKKALAKGSLKRPGSAWLLQGLALVQNRQNDEGAAALREALKYDESRSQAEAWLRYLSGRS